MDPSSFPLVGRGWLALFLVSTLSLLTFGACSDPVPTGLAGTGGASGIPGGGTGGGTATGGAFGTGGGDSTGGGVGTGGGLSGGPGGSGALTPGVWNAFIPAGSADRLDAEYERWWQANYHDCGGIGQGNMVSEGVGYGMLITVAMGDQTRFDTINTVYHNENDSPAGLMDWQCAQCGGCSGNAAMDADLDAAMALLMAAERWGGGYEAQAVAIIQKLRGPLILDECLGRKVLRPGDASGWGGCNQDPYYNPSYWTPAYYRVFAEVDPAGADIWNALVDEVYLGWQATLEQGHPDNLFIFPDGARVTASGWESSKGYAYNGYDACRVPWRIATDYAWTGDARAAALLQGISQEVENSSLGAVAKTPNSAFYGAVALSGVGVDQATADAYFNEWMAAEANVQWYDDGPYYQGTLRMLYLLLAAGAFNFAP